MKLLGLFSVGFAAGWVARSSVDSSRGALVSAIATVYGAADRARRFVAVERENLEDLLAEAKARHHATLEREAADVARASTSPRRATNGHAGQYVQ